jgi:hypothetical protein
VKHRVIGTIMFGLGVLLLVVAVGLRFYVAPTATKIPYDLDRSTSIVEAKNATYLQIDSNGLVIHTGNLHSSTDVVPQPKLTEEKMTGDLKGKAVVWDVYSQTTADSDGTIIDASTNELAIDRVTGAAAPWAGAWENSSNQEKGQETKTNFQGHSYKFPFHTAKKTYPVWDGTLGKTFPANFRAVEKVAGLEVYKFEQVIDLQPAPLDAATGSALAGAFAPGATGGQLYYSNTRTLWIEPVTGQFADVREQRHIEFVADNGIKQTLLDADFRYTKDTVKDSTDTIKDNRNLIQTANLYGPIIGGAIGLALIIFGVMLARRSRTGAHADDGDDRAARQMSDA